MSSTLSPCPSLSSRGRRRRAAQPISRHCRSRRRTAHRALLRGSALRCTLRLHRCSRLFLREAADRQPGPATALLPQLPRSLPPPAISPASLAQVLICFYRMRPRQGGTSPAACTSQPAMTRPSSICLSCQGLEKPAEFETHQEPPGGCTGWGADEAKRAGDNSTHLPRPLQHLPRLARCQSAAGSVQTCRPTGAQRIVPDLSQPQGTTQLQGRTRCAQANRMKGTGAWRQHVPAAAALNAIAPCNAKPGPRKALISRPPEPAPACEAHSAAQLTLANSLVKSHLACNGPSVHDGKHAAWPPP